MASERFVAIQAAMQVSPETPTWERWTIDEVDEDVVRVLVSRALFPDDLRAISESVLTPEGKARGARATRNALHEQAMRIELDDSEQRWSAESAIFVGQAALEELLRERGGKPGLPTNRPLREGDVFWIMVPADPGLALPADRGASLQAGAARVARYRDLGADVWDITAAARQVAKRDYHRVVRVAGDEAVADAADEAETSSETFESDATRAAREAARRDALARLMGEAVLEVDNDYNPLIDEKADPFASDADDEDADDRDVGRDEKPGGLSDG